MSHGPGPMASGEAGGLRWSSQSSLARTGSLIEYLGPERFMKGVFQGDEGSEGTVWGHAHGLL